MLSFTVLLIKEDKCMNNQNSHKQEAKLNKSYTPLTLSEINVMEYK